MEPVPLTGAETIHPNNKTGAVTAPDYDEAQKEYINFRRRRIIAARDARDMKRPEFDDMNLIQWYEVMKRADDQYVAPRKNKTDTAINLGTIRDKDTTLVEYAKKFDFEPVAQAYNDDDEMLEEVAETSEDLVRKSKLIEQYNEAKAKLIWRSMVAFGSALVEDRYIETWTPEKTIKKGKIGSSDVEWEEKLVKTFEGCDAKLWDLRKCYPGDIRKFFMNGPHGQPFFFTVEYETYDITKTYFVTWDMWKHVPDNVVYTAEIASAATYAPSWTLRPITQNYCEIIRYYDPIANEFAITINGVDMLPIMSKKKTVNGVEKTFVSGYPLTEISPSGAIPFAKYDLEPMHDFFFSKGQPAKMRVLADVENMMMKTFIRMLKQKTDPTMGNKSGRTFDVTVTEPSTVINDIREGDLFPVLPNYQGSGASDFSMFELVKKELDKNSVERSFQGSDNQPQDETATADMNNFKAQSLKVASMFDGIIFGENQLNWLRTFNIMKNWTKPIDQQIDVARKVLIDKYRTVNIPVQIDGGQKAVKKVVFTKDTPKRAGGKATLEDSRAIHQHEMDHQKENGGEMRLTLLHPEQFRYMKIQWFYTCVPVPNSSDPLSYMLFAKQITDAQTFFGPDSLNVKKLKHKFSNMTGQDFDTWFISEQELDQKRQQAAAAAAGGAPQDPNAAPQQTPSTFTPGSKQNLPGNQMKKVLPPAKMM